LSLRQAAASAALQVDAETAEKAVLGFARGPSAGPSGLRPQHVKDALVPGLRDEILRHITEVVNLLAQGRAPTEVQAWLCGAFLAAIPKTSGDLRPVAMGDF